MAFEASFALGADLTALAALVLVAGLTHGEGALVTGDEELLVVVEANIVAADLADLGTHALQGSRLHDWKGEKGKKRRN